MVNELQTVVPSASNLPDTLPILPLNGTVAFPLAVLPLVIGQPRSIELINHIMRDNRLVFLVAQREAEIEKAGFNDLYKVGTVAFVHQLTRSNDGTLKIIVQGLERAKLVDLISEEPYLVGRIEIAKEPFVSNVEIEGLRRALLDLLKSLGKFIEESSDDLFSTAENLTDTRQLAYLIAMVSPIPVEARQEILELDSLEEKLRRLIDFLQREVTIRELGKKIVNETQKRMSKAQRDYFLREQVRSIQNELGENQDQSDTVELRKKIEEAHLPEEAQREANRELDRLAAMPAASAEYGMIRSYLEWLASLPWSKLTGGAIDVPHARQVLDADHYDLDKVKDRILEYLSVRQLRQERSQGKKPDQAANSPDGQPSREPILCFVGPPGVGKTSLGQSIARALGRSFVRVSLGGLHDESEIRGHRRTYIGAMPGRVIQGIRRAGSRDPVFMLDEIDKVGSDWRGDPSSALLEVLDPAQNQSFMDNYLGVSFDLSQVLFIATANTLETIPPPLLDRMEIISLSGYTDEEKIRIAERYLIPKQLEAHALSSEEISFQPQALRRMIRGYTREAGVRNLDREIAAVCRKFARELAEGKISTLHLSPEQVASYLGRPRFFDEVAERMERPGVATGLAWTPTGGDVLFVEATMMPSRNEQMILTGMLGDVMRESAQAAFSYIRSNARLIHIDPQTLEGKTIHIHVPAGAIPKDGPSAGVTMVTALASLVTGKTVRSHLAMTGEITLRGKVLPVGGIKEKTLAAQRAGIKTVILPRYNEKDLEDIPAELRNELQYIFVDTIEEVLQHALDLKDAAS